MYRVLIADDETAVIRSLKDSIHWEELNLEISGIAMNGYEAIGIAEKMNIDIAILDIRMPGVNGLELCEYLKQRFPDILLILISGYAEFEYAQKGIAYGVLGYCLKPLDYSEITRLLIRAVGSLKKGYILENGDLLEALDNNETKYLKKFFDECGWEKNEYYIAASTGDNSLEIEKKAGITLSLGRGMWSYILKYDYFDKLGSGLMESGTCSGLGYYKKSVGMNEIFESLKNCTVMAYQYFINEKYKICVDIPEGRSKPWLEEVKKSIANKAWNILIATLCEIRQYHVMEFNAGDAMKLCNIIFLSELFSDDTEDYYIYSLKQLVTEYSSFDQMLNKICDMIREAMTSNDSEISYGNVSFLNLLKYVDQNYKENITLSTAAKELHLNANYVSQLFKKEAGVTFVYYITQKRLECAKNLLTTTQKTITDIAIEVGFNDYFYFIKTFKKSVGMTPGQYRNGS